MNRCLYISLIVLFLLLPREASASSMPTDPASLEAMIHNHKTVKAVLELRVIAEEGVRAYHRKSMKGMEDHEAVARKLDKYRKCFEKIDFILNASATGFHTYNSFQKCRKNLTSYYKLLDTYTKEILLHGGVWTSDTTVLYTSRRAVEGVSHEANRLWKSYGELAAVVTGKRNCTTADMMLILDDINLCIDGIEASIRNAYMELWAYMTVRMGFWKKDYYLARSIKDIAGDALGRWLGNSTEAFQCLEQHKSYYHEPLGGGGLVGGRRYN